VPKKTTDTITKEYVEGCGLVYDDEGNVIRQEKIRSMSPFEIKERLELNRQNTASNLRAKVVAHNSKQNGR
jgi:hypothetical protein